MSRLGKSDGLTALLAAVIAITFVSTLQNYYQIGRLSSAILVGLIIAFIMSFSKYAKKKRSRKDFL